MKKALEKNGYNSHMTENVGRTCEQRENPRGMGSFSTCRLLLKVQAPYLGKHKLSNKHMLNFDQSKFVARIDCFWNIKVRETIKIVKNSNNTHTFPDEWKLVSIPVGLTWTANQSTQLEVSLYKRLQKLTTLVLFQCSYWTPQERVETSAISVNKMMLHISEKSNFNTKPFIYETEIRYVIFSWNESQVYRVANLPPSFFYTIFSLSIWDWYCGRNTGVSRNKDVYLRV